MAKFDKKYFIKKFSKIAEDKFTQGNMSMNGKHCAMGHCGVSVWKHTEESLALTKLINPNYRLDELVVGGSINNANPVINLFDKLPSADVKASFLKVLENLEE